LKKLILSLLIICAGSHYIIAQGPSIQWQKCYGGTNVDQAFSIIQTSDGGYFIAGISRSDDGDVTVHYGTDIYADWWVVKTDANGNLEWQKNYGGTDREKLEHAEETPDGGYIMTGWTHSIDGDISGNPVLGDAWLVKIDSSGNIEWENTMGSTGTDQGYRVACTADGGYIMSGNAGANNGDVSGNHGFSDYWVVKVDSTGSIQWQKCFGGSTTDEAASISLTANGGFILAGPSYSNDGDVTGHHGATTTSDCWVLKADSARNIIWQNSFGGTRDEEAFEVKATPDGGCIVVGSSLSNDGNVTGHHGALTTADAWVFKLDSLGSLQWQKSFGGTDDDEASWVSLCNDGGYIIGASTASIDGDVTSNHGDEDFWLIKIDGLGNIQWQKTIGGSAPDECSAVEQTTDGGFIAAGFTESNDMDISGNHGTLDYALVKLANDAGVPSQNSAQLNYSLSPNPFHFHSTLHITHFSESANLEIYNTLGAIVKEQIITSENTVITREGLSNGIYFILVNDGSNEWKSKIIIE
jgi:hypothetical protein